MSFYANLNNGTILKNEWEAEVCYLRHYTSALLWLLQRQANLNHNGQLLGQKLNMAPKEDETGMLLVIICRMI